MHEQEPTAAISTVGEARTPRWSHVAALAVLCAAFYWAGNDRVPLFDRDEPRYAVATREMLQSGNWVVPYFNGSYRFHKPILIYWLMAAAYTVFGTGEFAARFFSGAFAAGSVVWTYVLGTWMFGRRAGVWSAVVLATAPLICFQARLATPDATLLFFTTAAFACLWKLLPESSAPADTPTPGGRPPLRWAVGFWLALAFSALVKGPVGPAIFCFVLGTWSLLRGWEAWRRMRWGWGAAIFLAVNLPWYVAVTWQSEGEFVRVFLGQHVLQRAATPMEGHRGFPGMYPLSLFLTFSPWITLVVPALRQRLRAATVRQRESLEAPDRHPIERAALPRRVLGFFHRGLSNLRRADPRFAFLTAWTLGPLLMLEPLQTKLVHYYLPAYPAFALLVGQFLAGLIATEKQSGATRQLSRLTPAARLVAASPSRPFGYEMLGVYAALGPVAAVAAWFVLPRPLAVAVAVSLTIGGLLNFVAFLALRRGRALRGAVLLACVAVWLAASTAWWILPAGGPYRLSHRVARQVKHHAAGGATVLYGFDEPSVVFYLGGRVPRPRSHAELVDLVERHGPVVSALTDRDVAMLQPNPHLRMHLLESLTGFNLGKGRRQTVQILRLEPTAPFTATAPALTAEALKNTSYDLGEFWPDQSPVQLAGGIFREQVEGTAVEQSVRFISGLESFGDLNADGVEDAVVVLCLRGGGSGSFFRLAAVINRDGKPKHVATAPLGDRVRIRRVKIESGVISVEMVTHDADDAQCCPTLPVIQQYRLQRGRLTLVSSSKHPASLTQLGGRGNTPLPGSEIESPATYNGHSHEKGRRDQQ